MTVIELAGQKIEIAGVGDLARRWGVTTQRVRQLAQEEGFPPMLGEVNGNPVYDADECDGWRQVTRRRPGRHRRVCRSCREFQAGLREDSTIGDKRVHACEAIPASFFPGRCPCGCEPRS